MLPKINGKKIEDCNEEDLQVILDNPDYRENEYIDFKRNFSFLEMDKKSPERKEHISEFKSDICSFANAGGGYLIYGISDNKGMADKINGISIKDNNIDKFELDRKNNLNNILPKLPYIKFSFVPLSNGNYVVIIYIMGDRFAPYFHLEDEKNYKIYKRVGNGKQVITYTELKNMFNQSLSLENEILEYRKRRVDYYLHKNEMFKPFYLLHIIPDTFLDSSYNENVFVLNRKGIIRAEDTFRVIGCSEVSIPFPDGIRFEQFKKRDNSQCCLCNNFIVECCDESDLINENKLGKLFFAHDCWENICDVIRMYVNNFRYVLHTNRFFVCISLINYDDCYTDTRMYGSVVSGRINEDVLLCTPVTFNDFSDEKIFKNDLLMCKLQYFLSVGISSNSTIQPLIDELYDDKKEEKP